MEKNNEENIKMKVQLALAERLRKERFVEYDINVKPISTNGGNYLSELFEIEVKGNTDEGKKELNIFMKKIIADGNFTLWSIATSQERELYFYYELSHIYNKLQIEAGIPENERYKIAKHYQVEDPKLLMLENYAVKNYRQYGRMKVISLPFAELCFERIAKFHALSFALENKDPEYFNANMKPKTNYYSIVVEKWYNDWKMFLNKVSQSSAKLLEGEARERLLKYSEGFPEKFLKYSYDTKNYKACMIHGDFKPNNILILENDGVLSDIIPIDYQLVQYANPLNDFFFYIFIGTDQEFRRNHLEHLKNHYYEHFTSFLKYFGLDADNVYPRVDFEREYMERLDFGLIMFLILVPFDYAPDDDIPNLEKDIESNNFAVAEEGRDRVAGVVDDFIKWGYL